MRRFIVLTLFAAGIALPVSVAGADFSYGAWVDRNRDGLRQTNETEALEVVPPYLEWLPTGATTWQSVTIPPVQRPDGRWAWTDLMPGDYRATAWPEPHQRFTTPDVGNDDANDSDFIPMRDEYGWERGYFHFNIAGADVAADAGLLDQRGEFSYGAWIDRNRDGLRQTNETEALNAMPPYLEWLPDGATTWQSVNVFPMQQPDGRWAWSDLMPGHYRATAWPEPHQRFTTPDVGSDDASDSDFMPMLDEYGYERGYFHFDIAGADVAADAGFLDQRGDFAYTAWLDRNRDGLHQADETEALMVVPPYLEWLPTGAATWQSANVYPTQLTDGRWVWSDLMPGHYRATAWSEPHQRFTTPDVGSEDANDSDFIPMLDEYGYERGYFHFDIAGADVAADAGFLDQRGDFSYGAWIDRNRDGLHQADETEALIVLPPHLEWLPSGATAWQSVTASPTQLPDGRWAWTDLMPGHYRANALNQLYLRFTQPDVGSDYASDSDFIPMLDEYGWERGYFYFDVAGADVAADAGFLDQRGDFSYGAWIDRNRDGLRQADETETLIVLPPHLEWLPDGATTWQYLSVSPVQRPDGRWAWTDLMPGHYRANVRPEPHQRFTPPDVGSDDASDSDFIPMLDEYGWERGYFHFDIAGADVAADAGFLDQRGDFSYGAWIDRNRDGLRQVDETEAFVVVPPYLEWLPTGATDWQFLNVSPIQLPNGRWTWSDLMPGNYRATAWAEPHQLFTAPDVGSDDTSDSDFISILDDFGQARGYFHFTIAGADIAADAGFLDQRGDVSVGAWIDRSGDGLRQSHETDPAALIAPVLEWLPVGSTTWQPISGSPTPMPDGRWWWLRLMPGQYRLTVVSPPETSITAPDVGSDDEVDSDVDANGQVAFVVAGSAQHFDAGFVPLAPPYVSGLHAEFFDFWSSLSVIPDLSTRLPQVVRSDAQIAYASTNGTWSGLPSSMTDTFASRHSGFLKIDVPGTYTLFIASDDGSRLYLDETLQINNDGLHGMRERSVTLSLTAGYHPLRIEFFENGGGAGLLFSWSGPGIAKALVPASALWHLPTAITSLPTPWITAEIGAVGLAGSASGDSDGENFIITGSGNDIWNTSDAFHFVHRPLDGNGSLIARVMSLDNTNAWAKAGVMVRASNTANSTHAMMVLTPGNGASFQYRTATGASSSSVTSSGKTAPHWVKVSRSGNSVSGWISSDGIAWTQVGSTVTVPLGVTPWIGLAVTAHDNTRITTAVFEQVVLVPASDG